MTPLAAFVTRYFVGTWIALIIGGCVVFTVRHDAAFQRKWYPLNVCARCGAGLDPRATVETDLIE
jgi:hypothetical protein